MAVARGLAVVAVVAVEAVVAVVAAVPTIRTTPLAEEVTQLPVPGRATASPQVVGGEP